MLKDVDVTGLLARWVCNRVKDYIINNERTKENYVPGTERDGQGKGDERLPET